jgi:DNA-binding transcriptional regulator GbsR (MarR family)
MKKDLGFYEFIYFSTIFYLRHSKEIDNFVELILKFDRELKDFEKELEKVREEIQKNKLTNC